jgi:hypothetical protein
MTDAARLAREMRQRLAQAQRGVNLPRGTVEQWVERLEALDTLLTLAGERMRPVTTYTTGTGTH